MSDIWIECDNGELLCMAGYDVICFRSGVLVAESWIASREEAEVRVITSVTADMSFGLREEIRKRLMRRLAGPDVMGYMITLDDLLDRNPF